LWNVLQSDHHSDRLSNSLSKPQQDHLACHFSNLKQKLNELKMRSHEWLYECALDAAFPTPQRLHIQVFDDGTMTGTVEDVAPQNPLLAAAQERLVGGTSAGFKFYILDGSATWRDVDGDGDLRCRCEFRLMRFSKRLREGQLMDCVAELLPPSRNDSEFGPTLYMAATQVRRCIQTYAQDLALPATCSMRFIEQRVQPSIAPLIWRMTPGTYTFNGFTCSVSEMLYECKLTLQLANDGSLSGFSEDLIHTFTRKSRLQGFWSAECVTFQLFDNSGDRPHVFVYSLAPHPSGLRGSWHEQLTKKCGYFQEGHVELMVDSAQRCGTWKPSLHEAYPMEFQVAAEECLSIGVDHRDAQMWLPQDVWECVLSNCAYDWF
jgi:hypothetical protein